MPPSCVVHVPRVQSAPKPSRDRMLARICDGKSCAQSAAVVPKQPNSIPPRVHFQVSIHAASERKYRAHVAVETKRLNQCWRFALVSHGIRCALATYTHYKRLRPVGTLCNVTYTTCARNAKDQQANCYQTANYYQTFPNVTKTTTTTTTAVTIRSGADVLRP